MTRVSAKNNKQRGKCGTMSHARKNPYEVRSESRKPLLGMDGGTLPFGVCVDRSIGAETYTVRSSSRVRADGWADTRRLSGGPSLFQSGMYQPRSPRGRDPIPERGESSTAGGGWQDRMQEGPSLDYGNDLHRPAWSERVRNLQGSQVQGEIV